MLPPDLNDAITRGDGAACAAFFQGMDEDERRALAPAVAARFREFQGERALVNRQFAAPVGQTKEDRAALIAGFKSRNERAGAALTALYATANFREIKHLDQGFAFGQPIYEMLAARRPSWIEQWVDWTLDHHLLRWSVVRRLVREGLCARPASDSYYLGMLPQPDLHETLAQDPELLDHEVWRLFEIEGRPDASFAQNDKYASPSRQWAPTLVELAREGRIDRGRLLGSSLAALQRGFKQFQAAWFSSLHEALEPDIGERVILLPAYLHLLASPIPPIVSFALKALQTVEQAGRLPAEEFLEAVSPVLYARERTAAETAIRMFSSIAKQRPELRERMAAVTVAALEHSAAPVQKKALDFIRTHGDPARLSERLDAAAGLVAPSLRVHLERKTASPPKPGRDLPDPRLKSVPAKWRSLAGIKPDGSLEPLDLRNPEIPRLTRALRIQPLVALEELVQAFLRVLETEGPPDEIERVLDGVSRLCADRPEGFERLVSPLRKRATQLAKRQWPRSPAIPLAAAACAWIDREEWTIRIPFTAGEARTEAFLYRRVEAIVSRMRQGIAQPLLSAPTHAGGWIDPDILRKRMRASPAADEFDLQAANLRSGASDMPAWLRHPLLDANMIRWAATIAPTHRDEWFRTGASVLLRNIDWWSAEWGNKAYLEALFEPDTPLGEEGLRLLIVGLAAKENGEGTVAVDALIAAIADGRVDSSCLAGALRNAAIIATPAKTITVSPAALSKRLAQASVNRGIKLPRIAKRLTQASQASPLHGATMQAALAQLFESGTVNPLRQLFEDLTAEYAGYDPRQERLRARLDRAERWSTSLK